MNSDAQLRSTYNRRASAKRPILLALLLANLLYSTLAFAQVLGTGQLNIERRSHTATLLENEKVLIVGGDNQNGIVSQAEIFDPVSQMSSLAAPLISARTDHTATRLPDNRVLVIGGRDQTGSLQSTEIYNPLTTSFVAGPAMMRARSGHTATILANDKILIIGGDLFGSAEIYDPETQSFSLVTGALNAARKYHSGILLQNGQVMIVGGVNAQDTMLNTAEVFDSASQTFYLPPTDMQTARAFATLKLLPDGKVQIIGGDAELSMEVFDPRDGVFIAKALLPPNSDLLGATLSTQSRAALFSPSISQDPLLQGILTAEQLSLLDRADQSITELPSRNQALVAGGVNSAGQVLKSAKLVSSSRASVTTDKTDYAPGQIVTITGSGFQPNEQVQLSLHEFPEEYPDISFSAVANQQGKFVATDFAPQLIDLERVFTLTAIGQSSGFAAQTAFKDGAVNVKTVGTSGIAAGVNWARYNTASCSGTVLASGTISAGTTGNGTGIPSGTSVGESLLLTAQAVSGFSFTNWTGGVPAAPNSSNPICVPHQSATRQIDLNYSVSANTITAVSSSQNSSTFGQSVNFTATVTRTSGSGTPVGSVQFKVNGTNLGSSVTLSAINAMNASATSVAVATLAAGTHVITAEYAPGAGFKSSTGTLASGQVVNRLTIVVTPTAGQNKTYGSGDPTLTYGSAPALISGDSFSGELARDPGSNVGFYNITQGTLALSSNYTLNFTSGVQFEIKKLTIVVTPTAGQNKTYGSGDPTLTYSSAPALISGDSFSGELARDPGSNVGFYNITQGTLALSSNYTLNFTSGVQFEIKKLTIVVTPTAGQNKTYGSGDPTLTYSSAPALISGDSFSGELARDPGSNVGFYNITQGTLALSSNYTLNFTSGVQFEIKKLTIVVTPTAGQNKTYGSGDPTLTYSSAPALISGDSFSGELARDPGSNVGFYNITQGTLALSSNYTLNFTSGVQFEIKKLTIVVTPTAGQNKTYGSGDPTLTYSSAPALISGDSFSGELARDPGSNVGFYNITQGTLALSSNYTLNFTSGVQFEIKKLTIVVTPTAGQNKTYGSGDPTLTYSSAPALISGDSFSGELARDPGSNVGFYNITQGTLALSSNYTLNFTSGVQFEIKKLTIVVTPTAGQNKTYGSGDPTLTYSSAPALISGDSFSGELARDPGSNVGFYNITQGTLALSSNYTLNFTSGVQFEIKKLTIVVTPTAGQNKTYGSGDPTLTYSSAPALISGDSFSGELARDPGSNVGFYNITQGTLALSSNYTLNFTSGVQFEIKKRSISLAADAKSKFYGDTDPALTYQITSGSLKSGDTITGALTRVTGENFGTYAISQGTLAISDGNSGNNYDLTFVGALLTIDKRVITITADTKTKIYSESDPALTYQVTSGSLVFGDMFTGALSRVPGELVGTYAIQQGTLGLNNNYLLTYIGANLTITTGFAFNGFHSPVGGSVENGDGGTYANPVKSFKLGSTIPVKFGASWLNGGAALITGIHTLQAIKYSNSIVSEPAIDATPTDAATNGNQFRLTSTDWHFNLSTKGNGFTAGTWLLSATLVDGSQHTVWISIKK